MWLLRLTLLLPLADPNKISREPLIIQWGPAPHASIRDKVFPPKRDTICNTSPSSSHEQFSILNILLLLTQLQSFAILAHRTPKLSNMQFGSTILVLAFALANGVLASPIETNNLVELYQEEAKSGGSIVYYGNAPNENTRREESSDHPELYRETTASGGQLIYYGAPTNEKTRREPLSLFNRGTKTCPISADPSCDAYRHGAQNELCDKLLAELGDHSEVKIQQRPRQICYKNGKACCVSWGTKLSASLTKGDLYPHAEKSKHSLVLSSPLLLNITC